MEYGHQTELAYANELVSPATITEPAADGPRFDTREAWLQAGALRIAEHIRATSGLTVPTTLRIGVGWPAKGKRSNTMGECWAMTATDDGVNEIVMRTTVREPVELLAVLTHECIHAALNCEDKHGGRFKKAHAAAGFEGSAKTHTTGQALRGTLDLLAAELGEYPGARGLKDGADSSAGKKQTTRMLKVECDTCGFVFRTTAQWIDAAESDMQCPARNCEGTAYLAV